jgi:hypothetical protein
MSKGYLLFWGMVFAILTVAAYQVRHERDLLRVECAATHAELAATRVAMNQAAQIAYEGKGKVVVSAFLDGDHWAKYGARMTTDIVIHFNGSRPPEEFIVVDGRIDEAVRDQNGQITYRVYKTAPDVADSDRR